MASEASAAQKEASDAVQPSFADLHIKNTSINEAAGVQLSQRQKLLVGSVLDLFGGNPTLKHFTLWKTNATFTDPLTIAEGEAKYKAQWYGLCALFNPIQIQQHEVKSAGNPIEFTMSNKYTVKGIKKEQVINSTVKIHVDDNDGKISLVEDRWNDSLPEGPVSSTFRKLNAVSVPAMVKIPKTDAEDMQMKAERESS